NCHDPAPPAQPRDVVGTRIAKGDAHEHHDKCDAHGAPVDGPIDGHIDQPFVAGCRKVRNAEADCNAVDERRDEEHGDKQTRQAKQQEGIAAVAGKPDHARATMRTSAIWTPADVTMTGLRSSSKRSSAAAAKRDTSTNSPARAERSPPGRPL